MTRTHNEYFRRVYVKSVIGPKHRNPELIAEILDRPENRYLPKDEKEALHRKLLIPYNSILGEETSRKSCPECKAKLEPDEWVWSWGEYLNAKWRTVRHFCKACFPDIRRDLEVHRSECGCDFNLVGYSGEQLPDWLTIPDRPIPKSGQTSKTLIQRGVNSVYILVIGKNRPRKIPVQLFLIQKVKYGTIFHCRELPYDMEDEHAKPGKVWQVKRAHKLWSLKDAQKLWPEHQYCQCSPASLQLQGKS